MSIDDIIVHGVKRSDYGCACVNVCEKSCDGSNTHAIL